MNKVNIIALENIEDGYTEPAIIIVRDIKDIKKIESLKIKNFITAPYTQEELEYRIKLAIDSYQHDAEVEDKINIDDLTGLYNKKYLYQCLADILETKKDYFLVMMDLDNFGNINKTYGHIEGDRYLKSFTKLLQNSLRNDDLLFRFGGEEFILLLENVTLINAKKVIERIKGLIERELPFTVSCGLTKLNIADKEDEVLNRADLALRQAKAKGKNMVYIG